MGKLEQSLKDDYERRQEHGFIGYSHIYYNNYKNNRAFDSKLHALLVQKWEKIEGPPFNPVSLVELKNDLLISLCFHDWENRDQYKRALDFLN